MGGVDELTQEDRQLRRRGAGGCEWEVLVGPGSFERAVRAGGVAKVTEPAEANGTGL